MYKFIQLIFVRSMFLIPNEEYSLDKMDIYTICMN